MRRGRRWKWRVGAVMLAVIGGVSVIGCNHDDGSGRAAKGGFRLSLSKRENVLPKK